MKKVRQDILSFLGILSAIIFLPMLGAFVHFKGNVPNDYYEFPPLSAPPKMPFNLTVFIIIAAICLFVVLLYVVPQWFGFKKTQILETNNVLKKKLPTWFWFGLLIFGVSLGFLWTKAEQPKIIVDWLLIPLFWGIIFIVDAWVYRRSGGKSIIAERPQTLVAIAVCSIGGWLLFEFLNFFVLKNWYYPAGDFISKQQFLIYSMLGSSALLTIVFEWYMLLRTFKKLSVKYTEGPKVKISKSVWKVVLIICLISLLAIPFFPNQLFLLIWLVPMLSLISVLSLRNKWTPVTPLEKGNWSALALIALAYFIQGVLYECWNYFGGYHLADGTVKTFNPGYWIYSVPYVDVLHVFEMPLLGLFGYLPFGVYCWVAWLVFAHMLGLNPKFNDEEY